MSKIDELYDHLRRIRHELDVVEEALKAFEGAVLPRGPQKLRLSSAELEVAVKMYRGGMPLDAVTRRMGYSPDVMRRELRLAGVELRGRGRGRKNGREHVAVGAEA